MVGVEAEDGEICKPAELERKITDDIDMVKANIGDNSDGGVGR